MKVWELDWIWVYTYLFLGFWLIKEPIDLNLKPLFVSKKTNPEKLSFCDSFGTALVANHVIILNGFFKLPIKLYLFWVVSISLSSTFAFKIFVSIDFTDWFILPIYFLETLDVSFFIDSSDDRVSKKLSFWALVITSVILVTYNSKFNHLIKSYKSQHS